MGTPFIGEVRIFGFNFAPRQWALCDGQLLPINQNTALFSLLGTQYGGDGRTTFKLPDLRGRVPLHFYTSHDIGQFGGEENVTLTLGELPMHNHFVYAGGTATARNPLDGYFGIEAGTLPVPVYKNDTLSTARTMHPNMVSHVGGSQPHTNLQPSQVLNFCISLAGIYPSRS